MENASKALLIAGAVLLVIAIIAIGMGIFGNARGVVNQAEGQIDNMSVQMHNKQFEQYGGTGKTLSEIKELISTFASNNKSVSNEKFKINKINVRSYKRNSDNGKFVADVYEDGSIVWSEIEVIDDYIGRFINLFLQPTQNKLYDVKCEYNSEGIIDNIVVYVWY